MSQATVPAGKASDPPVSQQDSEETFDRLVEEGEQSTDGGLS